MRLMIAPQAASPTGGAESAARPTEETLPASAPGDAFEDYLNANQAGTVRKQASGSESGYGQRQTSAGKEGNVVGDEAAETQAATPAMAPRQAARKVEETETGGTVEGTESDAQPEAMATLPRPVLVSAKADMPATTTNAQPKGATGTTPPPTGVKVAGAVVVRTATAVTATAVTKPEGIVAPRQSTILPGAALAAVAEQAAAPTETSAEAQRGDRVTPRISVAAASAGKQNQQGLILPPVQRHTAAALTNPATQGPAAVIGATNPAVAALTPTPMTPPAPPGIVSQRRDTETQRTSTAAGNAMVGSGKQSQRAAGAQAQVNAAVPVATEAAPKPMATSEPLATRAQRGEAEMQSLSEGTPVAVAAVAERIKIATTGSLAPGKSTPGAAKAAAGVAAVPVKGDALPSAVAAMPFQVAAHPTPLLAAPGSSGGREGIAQTGRMAPEANAPNRGVTSISQKTAAPAEGRQPATGSKAELEVAAAAMPATEQVGTSKAQTSPGFELPVEADASIQAVIGAAVPEAARANAATEAGAGKGKPNPAEIAASSQKGVPSQVAEGDLQRQTPEANGLSVEAPEPIGTVIAEQNRAMDKAPQSKTEATFTVSTVATGDPARGLQGTGTAAAKANGAHGQRETQTISAPAATTATLSTSAPATFIGKTIVANAPAITPQSALTSGTLNQVMEAADKMTSDGQSQVELQVNLGDGQQLTVRLQMSQGSFHPIFKTESPELRQAIEQNWAGFRSSASERGLEIATPVFESPSSGGSFDAAGNHKQSQQPEGETGEATSPETFTAPSPGAGADQPVTTPTAPIPVGSSVQMYA